MKRAPDKGGDLSDDTLDFEGVPRDNRGHTADVPHFLPASKSSIGGVDHDERGQARWKWNADIATSADPNAETFDYLKALDTDLEIAQSQKVRVLDESTKMGINPYDTAVKKGAKR